MLTRDHDHKAMLTQELLSLVARPKVLLVTAGIAVAAFTVTNALFMQDGEHPASLFAMRDNTSSHGLLPDERDTQSIDGRNVTRIVFQGQQAKKADRLNAEQPQSAIEQLPAPSPALASRPQQSDPMVVNNGSIAQLQELLAQLGFYQGEIDGKSGPMTARAIVDYKTSAGLQGIELSTDQLITSARNNLLVTAAIPAQRPETVEPRKTKTVTYAAPTSAPAPKPASQPLPGLDLTSVETVRKVQQALREYAGDHIVVDGVFGSQTSKAIAEFQSVFRMQITGEIDTALIERMVDVGMIDG